MIRPQATQALLRWRDVLVALGVIALGMWMAMAPGPVLAGVGTVVALGGAAWGLVAWRRMRFALGASAPGLVEIVEGRISYMGPVMGGAVALSELTEVQVLAVAGRRRCWRLKQVDGQALLIPLEAAGAQALYDSLIALPGMTHADLNRALGANSPEPLTLWRRSVQDRTGSVE